MSLRFGDPVQARIVGVSVRCGVRDCSGDVGEICTYRDPTSDLDKEFISHLARSTEDRGEILKLARREAKSGLDDGTHCVVLWPGFAVDPAGIVRLTPRAQGQWIASKRACVPWSGFVATGRRRANAGPPTCDDHHVTDLARGWVIPALDAFEFVCPVCGCVNQVNILASCTRPCPYHSAEHAWPRSARGAWPDGARVAAFALSRTKPRPPPAGRAHDAPES